jgi:hypothetical protein
MNIRKATKRYEAWLGRRLHILEDDLHIKHKDMRKAVFPFLRATFYRWAQTWAEISEDAARAPEVLAVGDLHVENFGTWRDIEGRLIWGINDFDEAWPLPYTSDLIRLATSALLAEMHCEPKAAIDAILSGYALCLKAGGRPIALAEHNTVLRTMAVERLHQPEEYWQELHELPEVAEEMPAGARDALARLMPEQGLKWHVAHRVAGLGSLGRQRYLAIADWRGGSVAREAKALAPSACAWAADEKGAGPIHYQTMLDSAVRCRDPFVRVQKRWIVRRLAPDCSRIELSALPKQRDEVRLLHAMGFETANVHLGSAKARVLLGDLKKRPRGWLLAAARRMEKPVRSEFEEWRRQGKRHR